MCELDFCVCVCVQGLQLQIIFDKFLWYFLVTMINIENISPKNDEKDEFNDFLIIKMFLQSMIS